MLFGGIVWQLAISQRCDRHATLLLREFEFVVKSDLQQGSTLKWT